MSIGRAAIVAMLAWACSSSGSGGTIGGGSGGSGSANGVADCQAACNLTAALGCPNETAAECSSQCESAYSIFPQCALQLDAVYSCTKPLPLADFECDPKGKPHLKAGYCDAETAAVSHCALGG